MSLVVAVGRHLQALLGSVGRLARAPLATLLTLLVIALALALPAALRLFVTNAQAASGNFVNAVDLSVYLHTDVPLAKAQQLAQVAQQRREVAAVQLISADQGLQDFRTYSGFGDALAALKDNPLPHVLHVRPRPEDSSPAALDSLRRYFSAWPEVDVVQIDSEWVLRFNAILELLRRLLLIAAALLGVGVLAVVGNTIRLEIAAAPRGDRSHQAGRRLERVRAPAVPVHRRALRSRRRAARMGAHRARHRGARRAGGDPGAAVRQPFCAARTDAARTSPHCSAAARCWDGWGPGSRRPGTCAASSRAPERRARDRRPLRWWRRSGVACMSVDSTQRRTRRASATRVRLPKEFSSTMTTVRSSITVCITRQRPASEM